MTDLEALRGDDCPATDAEIPVDKMFVRFQRTASDAVTKVRVMHHSADTQEHEGYYNTGGCTDPAWLENPLGTPLGVFASLLVTGFASTADMQAALHQFRNVQGQEYWATFMLLQAHDPNIGRILEQEDTKVKWGDPACKH